MKTEPLPCPFCGRTDILSCWCGSDVPGMEDCGYWSTGCSACGIEFHRDDQETAESDWNDRSISTSLENILAQVHKIRCFDDGAWLTGEESKRFQLSILLDDLYRAAREASSQP